MDCRRGRWGVSVWQWHPVESCPTQMFLPVSRDQPVPDFGSEKTSRFFPESWAVLYAIEQHFRLINHVLLHFELEPEISNVW